MKSKILKLSQKTKGDGWIHNKNMGKTTAIFCISTEKKKKRKGKEDKNKMKNKMKNKIKSPPFSIKQLNMYI